MSMDIIIRVIGIVFVFLAIVYLLKPDIMKRLMEFFKQGKRMYFAGLIRFILAIVFLLGANQCNNFWVILVFGILFIISGLLIFTLGTEKVRLMIDWYQKQSVLLLRVIALIVLAVGAVIIWAA